MIKLILSVFYSYFGNTMYFLNFILIYDTTSNSYISFSEKKSTNISGRRAPLIFPILFELSRAQVINDVMIKK